MIDLQHLTSLFDDEVLVRKYLERFHEDMPKMSEQMREAFEKLRWNELSLLAHSYKCQLQYLNESDTASIAYDVEKKSSSNSVDANEIGVLITLLENKLVNTLEEIQQIIE